MRRISCSSNRPRGTGANRCACFLQRRTHRERKELYIKALEDEVLRLKEIYSNISTDKERLSDENRQLKMMLAANGIPWSSVTSGGAGPADDLISNPSIGYTSSASVAGGGGGFTPSMVSHSTAPSTAGGASSRGQHMHGQSPPPSHGYHASPSSAAPPPQQQQRTPAIDYEQAGIDFVLTYDDPSRAYLSPPHQ